jgi:cell shape-determining protein MreC
MIVMRRLQLSISVIATLSFVLFLAQSGLSINASFAQTPNATNQTTAKTTGQPETTVLNKTTIPAQQTTVTVNQTSEPTMTNQTLQPLENLTNQTQALPSLSGIQNKTMVAPTGNATTTVVNKTTVPFNQTMVTGGGSNQSQQQQCNNPTSTSTY